MTSSDYRHSVAIKPHSTLCSDITTTCFSTSEVFQLHFLMQAPLNRACAKAPVNFSPSSILDMNVYLTRSINSLLRQTTCSSHTSQFWNQPLKDWNHHVIHLGFGFWNFHFLEKYSHARHFSWMSKLENHAPEAVWNGCLQMHTVQVARACTSQRFAGYLFINPHSGNWK